jgi:hypothetical protein
MNELRVGTPAIDISSQIHHFIRPDVESTGSPDATGASAARELNVAGPRVYVYNLPDHFRDNGTRDCSQTDSAFGGPPFDVGGYPIWHSGQFELGWMIYNRLLRSPRRAKTVAEADLFFIPAWSRNDLPCADGEEMWAALKAENPALCVTPRQFRDLISFPCFFSKS